MLNANYKRRKRDEACFQRNLPQGVFPSAANIKHFASVPSGAEWSHQWQLDHGRLPTNREIDVHFVHGPWSDG
jgi:hypothetical protein